jgi:hypothetical protein
MPQRPQGASQERLPVSGTKLNKCRLLPQVYGRYKKQFQVRQQLVLQQLLALVLVT